MTRQLGTLFILMTLSSSQVFAKKTLSQELYEEVHKVKCAEASQSEVSKLRLSRCNSFLPFTAGVEDKTESIDAVTEAAFFTTLADRQQNSLDCSAATFKAISADANLQSTLTNKACESFGLLQTATEDLEATRRWIKSYSTVNDAMIRQVPQAERTKNDAILKELRARENVLLGVISNHRLSSMLFEYDSIYEFAASKLKKGKKPEEVCAQFKAELPRLLKTAEKDVKSSAKTLDEAIKNPSKMNSTLKETLWTGSQQDELLAKLASDPATRDGLMCRMNGRYGEGAAIKRKLGLIASFSGPIILQSTTKLATLAYASRATVPLYISRAIVATELTVGASINVDELKRSCIDKYPTVLSNGAEACFVPDSAKRKGLILNKQSQGSCALTATMAAASGYFGAKSIDQAFKGLVPDSLLAELATRSDKLAKALSNKGIFDATEVVEVTNKAEGKLVTVARKKGETGWYRTNFQINVRDPVGDPNAIATSLANAGKKFGISASENKVVLPDAKYYGNRISKYNAAVPENKKIGISFYESPDTILSDKVYIQRFIESGELPMAKAGKPAVALSNTGHLHLHDMTLHGATITMPPEAAQSARTAFKAIQDFEGYLQKKSPEAYALAKKQNLFDKMDKEVTRNIDFTTGTWNQFLALMEKKDLDWAAASLDRYMSFAARANPREIIKHIELPFKQDPKVYKEFEDYLKANSAVLEKPTYGNNVDVSTLEKASEYLYQRHLQKVRDISETNF